MVLQLLKKYSYMNFILKPIRLVNIFKDNGTRHVVLQKDILPHRWFGLDSVAVGSKHAAHVRGDAVAAAAQVRGGPH
jgi:hypothetical protein